MLTASSNARGSWAELTNGARTAGCYVCRVSLLHGSPDTSQLGRTAAPSLMRNTTRQTPALSHEVYCAPVLYAVLLRHVAVSPSKPPKLAMHPGKEAGLVYCRCWQCQPWKGTVVQPRRRADSDVLLPCCPFSMLQCAPSNPPKLAMQPLPAQSQPSTRSARPNAQPTTRQEVQGRPRTCAPAPTPGLNRQAAASQSVSSLLSDLAAICI